MKENHASVTPSLFRISSRIMLVYGIFGLFLYLLCLVGIIFIGKTTGGIFSAQQDIIGIGLFLMGAVAELMAGIVGVRRVRRSAPVGPAPLVLGSLALGLAVAEVGFLALRSAASQPARLALCLALVIALPLVYLCSAAKLRKHSPEADSEDEFPEI